MVDVFACSIHAFFVVLTTRSLPFDLIGGFSSCFLQLIGMLEIPLTIYLCHINLSSC